jgi:hypothetical protein
MSAPDRTADRGPGPGAEQPAADRALAGVIGIGAARQRQYQARGNPAGGDQTLRHMVHSPQVFEPKTYELVSRQALNISGW